VFGLEVEHEMVVDWVYLWGGAVEIAVGFRRFAVGFRRLPWVFGDLPGFSEIYRRFAADLPEICQRGFRGLCE
jgi:hypothetical protein